MITENSKYHQSDLEIIGDNVPKTFNIVYDTGSKTFKKPEDYDGEFQAISCAKVENGERICISKKFVYIAIELFLLWHKKIKDSDVHQILDFIPEEGLIIELLISPHRSMDS